MRRAKRINTRINYKHRAREDEKKNRDAGEFVHEGMQVVEIIEYKKQVMRIVCIFNLFIYLFIMC